MSALEGIADKLAEAVHVADVPKADIAASLKSVACNQSLQYRHLAARNSTPNPKTRPDRAILVALVALR